MVAGELDDRGRRVTGAALVPGLDRVHEPPVQTGVLLGVDGVPRQTPGDEVSAVPRWSYTSISRSFPLARTTARWNSASTPVAADVSSPAQASSASASSSRNCCNWLSLRRRAAVPEAYSSRTVRSSSTLSRCAELARRTMTDWRLAR